MTIKEQLIQELADFEDAKVLQELLLLLQAHKGKRNRPLLTLSDLKHMQCPFPPEPEWESIWQEDQRKQHHAPKS